MILKNVERQIEKVEGFSATFMQHGRDVNGTKEEIPSYPFDRAAPNSWTVSEWITKRFKATYPGYDVVVRSKTGVPAVGLMKLSTIR